MMVKVCGITNAEDAHVAAEEGASALGFVFHAPSPRSVAVETAAEIVAELPRGIWRVGVFVNQTAAEITRVMQLCKLDVAQLHGDETPAAVPANIRAWKALRVADLLRLKNCSRSKWKPFCSTQPPLVNTVEPGGRFRGTSRSV